MSLPGIDCDVKSSGRACDTWSLEWTYSNGTGTPVLDQNQGDGGAWTDEDPRVTTPVADGGVGLTTIRFPKCRRVRVLYCNVACPTAGTSEVNAYFVPAASSGGIYSTGSVRILDYAGSLADPPSSSRGRLILQLEYN